ncbi:hypothetical protein V1503_11770 [Bacillus sp. SCS-151]|uniref:hypothetical protein n=1 Tax=Nanhaiella sioensis TaxID=3115293 RepID=UPI00397B1CAF
MKIPQLLKTIEKNRDICDILMEYFDLEIITPNLDVKKFNFETSVETMIIAEDGSGGIFALLHNEGIEDLPVYYINSEGQAGKVGENFEQFLSMIITIPYWLDLLKFSGNGQLSEMKKAQPFLLEERLEDFPKIQRVKDKITCELSINESSYPVENLHRSLVTNSQTPIYSLDGEKMESLFQSYKPSDNPLWKDRIV